MTTVASRTVRPARGRDLFAGTGSLFRLYLQRDRIKLPAWILGISFFVLYFSTVTSIIYSTPEDMQVIVDLVTQTAFGAFFVGPGYGMDRISDVQILVHVYGIEFLLAAAIMSILLVARHVRGEEESARGELLRAGAVASHASLGAALLLALAANAVLALCVTLCTIMLGHAVGPALLFGASVGAVGLFFAGVTAVTCQLVQQAGLAAMLGGAVLAVAWMVRGIGDSFQLHGHWLSWLSPIAWSQQTRAFVDDRWWPLALSLIAFLLTVVMAYWLNTRRDYGAGLIAAASGHATAPSWLRSPLALVWRQQQTAFLAWIGALALAGLVYGALGSTMIGSLEDFTLPGTFLGDAETFGIDLYIGLMSDFMAIIIGIFVLVMAGRLAWTENTGLADPVLATPVRRSHWLLAHLMGMAGGSLLLLAVAGLAMGLSAGIGLGDATLVLTALLSHLLRFPELAALAGLAVALYGLRPQWMFLCWASLVYGVVLTYFLSENLGVPLWVHFGSPYGIIPRMPPFGQLDPALWFGLLIAAAVLAVLANWAFTRRDIE